LDWKLKRKSEETTSHNVNQCVWTHRILAWYACEREYLNRLDKLLAVAFSLVSTKWNGIMSGEKRHHQIRYKNIENGKHTHSHGDLLRERDMDDGDGSGESGYIA
jgi:hypothetical protein